MLLRSDDDVDVEENDTDHDADCKNGRKLLAEHLHLLTDLATEQEQGDKEDDAGAEPSEGVITQVEIDSEAECDGSDIGNGLIGWQQVCAASVEDLATVCHDAIDQLSTKCTGSIQNDTKRKSLRERWLTSQKAKGPSDLGLSDDITIERKVHIKLEISEKATGAGEEGGGSGNDGGTKVVVSEYI